MQNTDPKLPNKLQVRIAALSDVAVRARTHIPRNGYTKEVIYVPEAESNTRLCQQLAQLAKGSALLDAREQADELDFALITRAAFDCIPPVRAEILKTLIAGQPLTSMNVPGSTLTYAKHDLKAQDLLVSHGGDALSPLALDMLGNAGLLRSQEKAA